MLDSSHSVEDVARYISGLNAWPEHHVGYLGDETGQVLDDLSDLEAPATDVFLVAEDEAGNLAGVCGVDSDHVTGRAWLYGPWVTSGDWAGVADALWVELQDVVASNVRDFEMFFDVNNTNCREFAERNQFSPHGGHSILQCNTAGVEDFPESRLEETPPGCFDHVARLHDRLFPGAYYTGSEILTRLSDTCKLFSIQHDGETAGYVYAEARPEFGEATIDFLGVVEAHRGAGVGTRLAAGALAWLVSVPDIEVVDLTVNLDNEPALRLFQRAGFKILHDMLSYRKVIASW